MESPRLRLAEAVLPPAPARRLAAAAAGIALLALGALASARSASAARGPGPSAEDAAAVVRTAIEKGADAPAAREGARRVRAALGLRPLDARTRVLYAGILADLATRAADFPAALFHARRAASQAPVTVPVVRGAALVLARCGEPGEALTLAAEMFSYDPGGAARLVAILEPYVDPARLRSGIPEQPAAWAAWIDTLRRQARHDEADARLAEAQVRWPDHRGLFEAFAARAVTRKDWGALDLAFARSPALRDEPAYALLFACRSRLAAAQGRTEDALADARAAVRQADARPRVLMSAAEALDAAGDAEGARATYRRALHALGAGGGGLLRVELLTRLARMEERRGHLGDALRAYREILAVNASHAEARKGVERLTTGGARTP